MSIENPTLAHFRHFSSLFTLSPLYNCRESSTNQLLFMQNKPNFLGSQMNVKSYDTNDYKNFIPLTGQKNKPNSNPIKPNLKRAKMNVNLTLTRDYRKNDDFAVQKNKPNSNPISKKPKMNANAFSQKDYENKSNWTLSENKPNQTQFRLIFYNFYQPEMLSSVRSDSKSPIGSLITFVFYEFCGGLIYGRINRRRPNYYRPQAPKTADLSIKKDRKKGLTFLANLGIMLLIKSRWDPEEVI